MNNEINFLLPSGPVDPGKIGGNRARNIIVGVLLIFLCVTIVGGGIKWQNAIKQKENFISSLTLAAKVFTSHRGGIIGGDIIVPPPKPEPPPVPILTGTLPEADAFSAVSFLSRDVVTGESLFKKNEYQKMPAASLVKLMSAIVILEQNPNWLATSTVVGEDALDAHMYAGDVYTLEELWQAAIVGSSNKAVLTLVSALGFSEEEFVEKMNQKAVFLGMTDTIFTEPTGLDSDNTITAADALLLFSEAMKQEKIGKTMLLKEITLFSKERKKEHKIWSTNWLLLGWIPGADGLTVEGGKTGYTIAANYHFITRFKDKNNHEIDVAVLGASAHEARFTEARDIGQAVFANFSWPEKKQDLTNL